MFKKLRNKIESKRGSKSLFWKSLVFVKDFAFWLLSLLRKLSNKFFRIINHSTILNSTVIVAGLGRCGTTLVYESLKGAGYIPSDRFLSRFNETYEFKKGYVYKTHDFPPENLPRHVKVIFMFGNPFDIVVSATNVWKDRKYLKSHYYHLNSPNFLNHDNLFLKDTFQLEKQFDRWNKKQNFDIIKIKYESLYVKEARKILNQFLGFKLRLPLKIKRKTDWTKHLQKKDIKKTYYNLFNKIENANIVDVFNVG